MTALLLSVSMSQPSPGAQGTLVTGLHSMPVPASLSAPPETPLPPELAKAVLDGYHKLGDGLRVAVRSSSPPVGSTVDRGLQAAATSSSLAQVPTAIPAR